MTKKEIKFIGIFPPEKKCIFIDGDGAATIKVQTDATQLASVLRALAQFKGKAIEFRLKHSNKGVSKNARKTYR